jgi:trehalose synthase
VQRHATVVTQKSLAEGFGLTVVEAMWKRRAVVATRVGGIVDQVDHEVHGLLVDDPADRATFARFVDRLLADTDGATTMAAAAYTRAHEEFLGDRHLEKYAHLLLGLG